MRKNKSLTVGKNLLQLSTYLVTREGNTKIGCDFKEAKPKKHLQAINTLTEI